MLPCMWSVVVSHQSCGIGWGCRSHLTTPHLLKTARPSRLSDTSYGLAQAGPARRVVLMNSSLCARSLSCTTSISWWGLAPFASSTAFQSYHRSCSLTPAIGSAPLLLEACQPQAVCHTEASTTGSHLQVDCTCCSETDLQSKKAAVLLVVEWLAIWPVLQNLSDAG